MDWTENWVKWFLYLIIFIVSRSRMEKTFLWFSSQPFTTTIVCFITCHWPPATLVQPGGCNSVTPFSGGSDLTTLLVSYKIPLAVPFPMHPLALILLVRSYYTPVPVCACRYRPPVSEEERCSECGRERRLSATVLRVWIWHAVATAAWVWR